MEDLVKAYRENKRKYLNHLNDILIVPYAEPEKMVAIFFNNELPKVCDENIVRCLNIGEERGYISIFCEN